MTPPLERVRLHTHIFQNTHNSTALLSTYDAVTPRFGMLNVLQVAGTVLLPLLSIDTTPFQCSCHEDGALPAPIWHGAPIRMPFPLARRAADWPIVTGNLVPPATHCQRLVFCFCWDRVLHSSFGTTLQPSFRRSLQRRFGGPG